VAEPEKLDTKYTVLVGLAALAIILLGVVVKLYSVAAAGDPRVLYSHGAKDVGDDMSPDIAYGKGKWIVVWSSNDGPKNTKKTDWDLMYTSSGNGNSWGNPKLLSNDPALTGAHDADASIATDGKGNWFVAWSSSADLGRKLKEDFGIRGDRYGEAGCIRAVRSCAAGG
jgi:hypothetical protein